MRLVDVGFWKLRKYAEKLEKLRKRMRDSFCELPRLLIAGSFSAEICGTGCLLNWLGESENGLQIVKMDFVAEKLKTLVIICCSESTGNRWFVI